MKVEGKAFERWQKNGGQKNLEKKVGTMGDKKIGDKKMGCTCRGFR